MTTMKDASGGMATAPAYLALSPLAKKALVIISNEIAARGEPVAISRDRFGLDHSGIAASLRELAALRFITIDASRRCNAFRLDEGWRGIQSPKDAMIAAAVARQPKPRSPRPVVVTGKPEKPKPPLDNATRREMQIAKSHRDRNAATSRLGGGHTWQAPPKPTLPVLNWPTNPNWRDLVK